MVESKSPPMECCTQKMVGDVSYTLFHDLFHRSIPYECLNECVYTRDGTSSPKFCFIRGDLPTECLADGDQGSGSGDHGSGSGDHGSGSVDQGSGSGDHGSGSGDQGSGSGDHGSGSGDHGSGSGDHGSG